MDRFHTADWITAFDWTGGDAFLPSEAALSARLLSALPARALLRALADSAEAAAFGRYITALRHARGWNRTQLARQAGIDPLTVPLLEQSALTRQELSPDLVARLARAFGIPVPELAINPVSARLAPVDTHPSFGRWLREQLAGISSRSSPLHAPQPSYRGLSEEGAGAPPLPDMLVRPLPLPAQELTARDGRLLHAALTLAPGSPPQRGIADLVVHLRDVHEEPVAGIELELELEGLPFICDAPSSAVGALRIPDLPLEMLAGVAYLTLQVV